MRTTLARVLETSPEEWWFALRRHFRGGGRPAVDPTLPCVFVLSTGRAGTQTLAALLALSRRIDAVHEPRPSLYGLSRLAYELRGAADAERVLAEAFLSMRISRVARAQARGHLYAETSPQLTFLAPAISRVVPAARFVHLVRDPRDVVRSSMRRGWYAGHAADATRIVPAGPDVTPTDWPRASVFEKNVWLWTETNRWILDHGSGSNSFITLRLEDVLERDPHALEALFDAADAEIPRRARIERVLRKRYNVQRIGRFPVYADWTAEQRQTLQRVAGDIAARLGYDLSCG